MRAEPAAAGRGRARLALALLLAAAWASAGARPFTDAVAAALVPNDFARDFVTAHAFAHGAGMPEGEDANAYGARIGVPRVPLLDAPFHFHPPPGLLLVLPLVPLGFRGAAVAWLALSLAALAWLAASLVAIADRAPRPRRARMLAAFGLLLPWPPVAHGLGLGQWSVLLAALVAAGWRAVEAERARRGGVLLGVAASLKASPLLLLGHLGLRHRRAAWAMLASGAALVVASAGVEGLAAWRAWLAAGPREVASWGALYINTASLAGLFLRLVGGAPARALALVSAGALVAAAAWLTARAPRAADRASFALWLVLAVVCNPLGWSHNLVLLLPALALLGPGRLTAAAAVLLTIPRETLSFAAARTPVLGGALPSLHLLGALLLFAAAAAQITGARRAAAHAANPDQR